jgi:hypothetical protein
MPPTSWGASMDTPSCGGSVAPTEAGMTIIDTSKTAASTAALRGRPRPSTRTRPIAGPDPDSDMIASKHRQSSTRQPCPLHVGDVRVERPWTVPRPAPSSTLHRPDRNTRGRPVLREPPRISVRISNPSRRRSPSRRSAGHMERCPHGPTGLTRRDLIRTCHQRTLSEGADLATDRLQRLVTGGHARSSIAVATEGDEPRQQHRGGASCRRPAAEPRAHRHEPR